MNGWYFSSFQGKPIDIAQIANTSQESQAYVASAETEVRRDMAKLQVYLVSSRKTLIKEEALYDLGRCPFPVDGPVLHYGG